MKKCTLALFILLFFLPANGVFAVTPNLDQGTMTLDLYGSYDGNHPLDYQLVLGTAFGMFPIDNLELAGVLGWQSNEIADTVEVGFVAEYNFYFGSPFVPFVQAGALWTGLELDDDFFNDESSADEEAWLGRFGAGAKYFVTDYVAISLTGVYDYASEKIYPDQDGNFDDFNWKLLLGINIYLY